MKSAGMNPDRSQKRKSMATQEGTTEYFKRMAHKDIPQHAMRELGKTGFVASSIGFGGYRIFHNSVEQAKALRYALLNGFNLIDTSSNYTDGGSEMLIGNLLQEMFERDELSRDEVIIVSKVGYVQGQNLRLARKLEDEGQPFPDMVKYMDGCWHCIHPDFLEDQLSRSLERLRLPSLDVYLLHNPEYFLSDQKKNNGVDVVAAHKTYYARIRRAFEWMEQKVREGKIQAYGVSSNTFPTASSDFEFTSLSKLIEIANSTSAKNYFKVIQFPFNLFEPGACQEKNQTGGQTLLQYAAAHGLGTLVNRPLNAMFKGRMIRLASFRVTEAATVIDMFHTKLTSVQRLEAEVQNKFLTQLPEDLKVADFQAAFSLGRQLQNAMSEFQDWEHWDHVKQSYLIPTVFSHLNYLHGRMQGNEEWPSWADSYAQAVTSFLDAITRKYENDAQERTLKLSGKLKSLDATLGASATLSQQALRVTSSVGGIHCTLLGMRRTPYVEDAIEAVRSKPVENAQTLISDLAAA